MNLRVKSSGMKPTPPVSTGRQQVQKKNDRRTVDSGLDITKIIGFVGPSIAPDWYDIAINLFSEDDQYYESIKSDNRECDVCLRRMLNYWKEKYPKECTLEKFIEGLEGLSLDTVVDKLKKAQEAGKNFLIDPFEKITATFRPLPPDAQLNNILVKAATKAVDIGYHLLFDWEVANLKDEESNSERLMMRIIREWRNSHPQEANFDNLIKALCSSEVHQNAVADELESVFGQQDYVKNPYFDVSMQNKELIAQLESSKQESLVWKRQIEKITETKDKEIEILKQQLKKANKDVGRLRKSIEGNETVKQQKKELNVLASKTASLRGNVEKLERKEKEQGAKICKLEHENNKLQDENKALSEKVLRLEKVNEDEYQKRYSEEKAVIVNEWKEKNDALEKKNQDLASQLKAKEKLLKETQQQFDVSEKEREILKRKLDSRNSAEAHPPAKREEPAILLAQCGVYPDPADIAIPNSADSTIPAQKNCNYLLQRNETLWEEIATQLGLEPHQIELIGGSLSDRGKFCKAVFKKWNQIDVGANYLKLARAVYDAHAVREQPLARAREMYQKILEACLK